MKLSRDRVPIVAGLTALLTLTCGIREDELRCEEAVAHLVDCCPGFDPKKVDCYFVSGGCDVAYPVLDIQESRCISAMRCEEVVSAGICSRAQTAQPDDGRRACP